MALRLRGATSGYIELKAPASAGDNTLTLPVNNGSANQLLKTDGNGNLSWVNDNSGVSLSGSTNNTIATVTGANALAGEANLTFDGNNLAQTIDASAEGFNQTAAGAHVIRNIADSNRSGANQALFFQRASWNGNSVAELQFLTGADTTNKDDGQIAFLTGTGGSVGERLRIDSSGKVGIGTTSPSTNLHVADSSGSADAVLKIEAESGQDAYLALDTSNGGGATADVRFQMDGTTKGSIEYVNNGTNINNMIFRNNANTERMKIKADGDIEVGGNLKTNNLSGRNLIINGAMQVAQRSSSSTTIGYHTVDRFQIGYGGHDEVLTTSQHSLTSSDTGPWEEGFRKSFHVQNGNQTSGADAGDYSQIIYKPEGQDINRSGWNFTDPNSKITLSYWIKASVAQNYYGFIEAGGPTRIFGWETGALTANTWKKVTVTIPGYATLAIPDTNGAAFSLAFIPYYGTSYTAASGRDVGQWYTGYNYLPTNTSTWWTTNNATFEITGIQLEVGSIATEFEHRSYGDELHRCQRYYKKLGGKGVNGQPLMSLACQSTTEMRSGYEFIPEMRAAPSISSSDIIGINSGNGSAGTPSLTITPVSNQAGRINATGMSGLSQGDAGWIQSSADAGYIAFSAEL